MLLTDVKELGKKIFDLQQVCLIVQMETDAICGCKILQELLKQQGRQHTIVAVQTKTELEEALKDYHKHYTHFILLNCGGTLNLLDIMEETGIEENNIIVIDSHRPININNVYVEESVHVYMRWEEIEMLPKLDDILFDEESDEDTPLNMEERLQKQIRQRTFERRRQQIMEDYEISSYIHDAISMILFEMAFTASKDNESLLWWAVTGVTSQLANRNVGRDKYISSVLNLNSHLSRLNHAVSEERPINSLKISLEHDLDLSLYRHWNLYDSLIHTFNIANSFKIWSNQGLSKLKSFVAEMGIPNVMSKQAYQFVDSSTRETLETNIDEAAEKFNLKNIRIQLFTAQHGFETKISASDMAYALTAVIQRKKDELLQGKDEAVRKQDNFFNTMQCLSRVSEHTIKEGIMFAKEELEITKKNVENALLNMTAVVCYGPYLYFEIKEGNPDLRMFSEPIFLSNFGHWLHHCYLRSITKRKFRQFVELPFVVSAPYDHENTTTLIVGLPPYTDDTKKNQFGSWFGKASEKMHENTTKADFFHSNIIKVNTEHKNKFLESLIAITQLN